MDSSRYDSSSRKRSRSPRRRDVGHDNSEQRDVKRHRSRSPRRHHHNKDKKEDLPFKSRHLHKHDFDAYKALFAEYLDLQKEINLANLDDHEARGRWKSFVGKWNRGELAKGWYDPQMKQKADHRALDPPQRPPPPRRPASKQNEQKALPVNNSDSDSDSNYGPTPPRNTTKSGPSIPNLQDLQQAREQALEDHSTHLVHLRHERKQDRLDQKEQLEDLVPRAAPGTRERQLEKKRDIAVSNRAFADAKEAGDQEIGESDLMGDDGDEVKKRKKVRERQKNEREIRKEEILRAREAEREERLAEHRRKEEKTMEYLRGLAEKRFG